MKPDWPAIRAHYESTGDSLRAVAGRFGVPERTLFRRAAAEKWQRSAAKNGSMDGSNVGLAAKNGSTDEDFAAKSGSKNGSNDDSAAKNGSAGDGPAAKCGSKNGSNDASAAKDGSKLVPAAATFGSKTGFAIPAEINTWDRLTAAKFYVEELHWAVHHLYPPDKGTEKERGKKPWCKGWRDHRAQDVALADLADVFGGGSRNNLGVVLRPPFVAVDLDSKVDGGESVRAWLAQWPELAQVPRERTAGGVHLHFLCHDVPAHVLQVTKAPTVEINKRVTAELYVNGLNLALTPSIHKSGHHYTWEVTGEFPEVNWAQLCEWFGFQKPEEKRPVGRPPKEKWWTQFKGDLATLDLLALFRSAGMLGECLSPEEDKWAVRCPWERDHSTQEDGIGSATVIFAKRPPAFKCLHAHCSEKSLRQVCEWFEGITRGGVDAHCRQHRGNFAAETLGKNGLAHAWGGDPAGAHERLIHEYGEPFVYAPAGPDQERQISDFNYLYWSGQFAFETLVIHDPLSAQFYTYDPARGLWSWQTDSAVRARLGFYLLAYSRRLNQPVLETNRSPERLNGMVSALKGIVQRRDPWPRKEPVIHLANGMLHLDTQPPQLRGFSPHYYSLHQCPIPFEQDAHCPRFLKELIYSSMSHEDAGLLQLMGGMFITGRNSWQKLLILTGTGGAGKGTIVRVCTFIVGKQNVKQLRTALLEERFELDNLDEASLLIGSDVAGDFLSCSGAKVIKSLTGGDTLTMERKGGRKKEAVGEHNIVITCNDKLRVRLDGDESAWKRRLAIIEFSQKAPRIIDDFEEELMREEASGILNWFILGAARLREASRDGRGFPMTPAQTERVEALLSESDSLRRFISTGIEPSPEDSLTCDEVLSAYENFSSRENWAALPRKRFDQQLGPLMMEIHHAAKRNDVKRGHSTKRGFHGLRVVENPQPAPEHDPF